ncbi:alpha/beta hydrolase [Sphingomonas sp. BT-65]|uniref:alpha/beta hydrolase n=1 Tax=Sphingomonas sp. BT-65 TaxID=2989821 RepID=UPI002235E3CC|nr:alpha/beta hydrolase [Sphingomonas sp. BT-65]MCW4462212.1 alpha/beta hydrolase [Sphingomonas sp. BT-65]
MILKLAIWTVLLFTVMVLALLGGLFLAQRAMIYPAPASSEPGVPDGMRPVMLETEDGLSLRAAYKPGAGRLPVIVFFHGNGDSLAGADRATERLDAAGYGRLLVEYRGYGANPGSPSEAGLYRDGRAALAWLAAQGVGRERIVLIGNSLGSGVAVQLASEEKVAALVLVSGFTSLTDAASQHYPWAPVGLLLRDRYDNRTKLKQVSAPVLVLHGTDDTLIPIRHGEQLAAASPNGALVRVRGAGHDLAYLPASQAKIVEWLARLPS